MGKIDDYIAYMMELVTNPKHGYDQIHRWGEDYDCSSAIITAVQTVIPVKDAGATYTGNMKSVFTKCGFRAMPYSKGMVLIRGDILLCHKVINKKVYGHTAMYIGNGKIAQFSINEKGTATGGQPGDQTGRESSVGNFYEYSKGWDYVLRYEEKKEDVIVEIKTKQLQRGDICVEVGLVQTLLNRLNYVGKNGRPLTIDNDFGANVEYAVKNFQKSKGIGQDGIVGPKTYDFLFKSNYI